ncbi:MAG TPA: hypothetical protein VG897_01775 [Terriglobales bacterium]|nr:hypothetical protein [Terriglobales bacterium]
MSNRQAVTMLTRAFAIYFFFWAIFDLTYCRNVSLRWRTIFRKVVCCLLLTTSALESDETLYQSNFNPN